MRSRRQAAARGAVDILRTPSPAIALADGEVGRRGPSIGQIVGRQSSPGSHPFPNDLLTSLTTICRLGEEFPRHRPCDPRPHTFAREEAQFDMCTHWLGTGLRYRRARRGHDRLSDHRFEASRVWCRDRERCRAPLWPTADNSSHDRGDRGSVSEPLRCQTTITTETRVEPTRPAPLTFNGETCNG